MGSRTSSSESELLRPNTNQNHLLAFLPWKPNFFLGLFAKNIGIMPPLMTSEKLSHFVIAGFHLLLSFLCDFAPWRDSASAKNLTPSACPQGLSAPKNSVCNDYSAYSTILRNQKSYFSSFLVIFCHFLIFFIISCNFL